MSSVLCGINVDTLAHHITTGVNENTLGITVDRSDVQAALPAFIDVVLAGMRHLDYREVE
jgi:hypothetical protein